MIKAIILDIDGIVLGRKVGVNFPLPSKGVTAYLQKLSKTKIPICLCTGKTSFTVNNIIKHLSLNSFHITDGGALIYNPKTSKIIKADYIKPSILKKLLNLASTYLDWWQIYTKDHKYTLKNKFPDEFQEIGMDYVSVDNFEEIINEQEVLKIELIYKPEEESFYQQIFTKFKKELSVQWAEIPPLLPNKIAIITSQGVNKRTAVDFLLRYLQISRKNTLMMGDAMMDWDFMHGDGYVATLANAKEEVKKLVKSNKGFIGKHVDEDGLIEVLEYYKNEFTN